MKFDLGAVFDFLRGLFARAPGQPGAFEPPALGSVHPSASAVSSVRQASPPSRTRPPVPVTLAELLAVMPHLAAGLASHYIDPLVAAMVEFEISTPVRAAAFLAQVAVESEELTAWEENLNYSAVALTKTWPLRFPAAVAAEYARQPERIANRAYANRLGNGPEGSGDGWRYRGRGPLGLTGLENYRRYGWALGLDLVGHPELVATTPAVGFRVAGRFWRDVGCNEVADVGDFVAVTKGVNGGLTGLDRREAYWSTAKRVLGV